MGEDSAVTPQNALVLLEKQGTPEAKAIMDYVTAIKQKNIAVLGQDEAFVLQDGNGQIKAFKKALWLSEAEGTLVKPGFGDIPYVVSAQGYEMWAEATGASVIFPKEVLVGEDWRQNPYAERDPQNRRILAVYARAIAFRYSSMGLPQVSDWTTIFDTPSYRMIDLLAKAKQFPQCFKVLPTEMKPITDEKETWASYPFDESMNLWINTSHNEVIKWLSQILNREKKALDFAQTFAKRNALKHLSGIQKAPGPQWRFPVLAWRPTGQNIVKWDAAQYAELQDRVARMIEGETDEFNQKIEIKQGTERISEDENLKTMELETGPDSGENDQSTEEKIVEKEPQAEPSKDVKQAICLSKHLPEVFDEALSILGIDRTIPVENYDDTTALKVYLKASEIVDTQN